MGADLILPNGFSYYKNENETFIINRLSIIFFVNSKWLECSYNAYEIAQTFDYRLVKKYV